ncbi:MAG: hypothetical protein D3916_16255 [Candidatus Electrothrix sp. MAN1_4]|nr:hypothetical protein [Candidatus Electrothrix sp. MAN1_4]
MIFLSYLPDFVRAIFKGMPAIWKSHHRLIFCWFVYMQALTPNKKTITELSRWSPARITEWRLRRLLYATYLNIDLLIAWFAQEAIKCFPPPKDKVVYVVGDGSHKDKRGKKISSLRKVQREKENLSFGASDLY